MAKILIVDDRLSSRQMLMTLLGYFDHHLWEANDGAEGLEMARTYRPDLIIADLLMPTMDGFELVRRLRLEPTTANTQVIFYTASYLEHEARQLADSCGVTHILMKPSDPEVILQTIGEALGEPSPPPPTLAADEFHEYHLKLVTGKLVEKLETVVPRMSALIEIGKQLTGERDTMKLLQGFCHSARELIGAKYAAVGLLGEDGQTFSRFITSGMGPDEAARIGHHPIGRGLLGTAITAERPFRVVNISNHPESIGFPPNHPQMRSFLGVPIMTTSRRYGAFYFTDKIATVEFTDEDEQIAATLAAQIGVAYENARRFEELQHEIAERKKTEELARQTEVRFQAVIDHGFDGIVLTGADGTTLYISPSIARLIGYQLEELGQGLPLYLFHPDDRAAVEAHWLTIQEPGKPVSGEYRMQHKDGSWRWIEVVSNNLLHEPEVAAVVTNVRDVTISRQAEAALRESEERYRTLFENLPIGLYRATIEGNLLEANPAMRQILGFPDLETLPVVNAVDLYVMPETRERWQALMTQYGFIRDFEASLKRYDGRMIWCQVDARAVTGDEGQVLYFKGSVRDITEQKQAQDELNALYRALSALLATDSTSLVSVGKQIVQSVVREFGTVDCGLMLVDANMNRMVRLARAGNYGVDTDAPIPLAGSGLVAEAVRTGQPIHAPDVLNHSSYLANDARTRSELVIPLHSTQGVIGTLDLQSPYESAFSHRDQRILSAFAKEAATVLENARLYDEINRHAGELEWRVAERTAQLEHTKERVEAILNNSSDAIIVLSLDGRIVNTNPAFVDLFGYQSEEIFDQPLRMLFDEDKQDEIAEALRLLAEGQRTVRLELVARRSDMTVFHADTSLSPIKREADEIAGVVCSVRDITLRRNMEEDLREALAKEKELSELKSRFVSMVSHEFRTPLTAIRSSSDLVLLYADRMTEERKREHLMSIQEQVSQLTHLLEDVLTLGRAESVGLQFNPVPLNLELICQKFIEEVQDAIGIPHQLVLNIDQNIPTNVMADEKLLRHIVSNLISNALKYSPEGSSVYLDVSYTDDSITIRIRDEGIGIPAEDQAHLYEAFHRANNVGSVSGSGLGLSIIKRAVEAHQGSINFESKEGVGTTFTVTLPVFHEELELQ